MIYSGKQTLYLLYPSFLNLTNWLDDMVMTESTCPLQTWQEWLDVQCSLALGLDFIFHILFFDSSIHNIQCNMHLERHTGLFYIHIWWCTHSYAICTNTFDKQILDQYLPLSLNMWANMLSGSLTKVLLTTKGKC